MTICSTISLILIIVLFAFRGNAGQGCTVNLTLKSFVAAEGDSLFEDRIGNQTVGQTNSFFEDQLAEDISDGRLDGFLPIEAAFILSGISSKDTLQKYIDWYEQLLATLKGFHLDPFDRAASASKVFSYLHSTWLLHYKEQSTTLIDVVTDQHFNCVAGTILYNLVCSDFGWQTEAFETPTHVYTIFINFTENINNRKFVVL